MFAWIAVNWGTLLVCAVLLAITAGSIGYLLRRKKRNRFSCCSGCSNCAMRGSCHGKES